MYGVYMPATTSQKIFAAARKVLNKEGAQGVTMRKVSAAVGITPMALYRHYPNRDGLLNALADTGFAELSARFEGLRLAGKPDHQLIKIIDVFVDHALDNPRMFELMFLTQREGARQYPADFKAGQSPTANVAADVIADAMKAGILRKDDVWEIVFEVGALIQGLIMLYLGGRMAVTPAEFRAFCHRSFTRYLHGILA